jgi:zinc protease
MCSKFVPGVKLALSGIACLAAVLVLRTAPLLGQQAVPQAPFPFANDPDQLPFDPAVRTGTLPNGLKYFVRQNGRPAHRVSMRLAVSAGSIDEADDQQGLAHLIEHMAFNGSTHFKPRELFSYFESFGARLGPHVNAQTGFDQTVYMLDLPSDNTEVITKGFLALSDFAGGLTFDAAALEKERGVVIEEWRGGLGAGSRVRDKQFPLLFYHSRYAERLPIGKPDIIRDAPVERLQSFYNTWYRPERIAVIAVGDVDASRMESEIRSAFTPLKDRAPVAADPDRTVPLPHPLLVSIITDPELTQSSVQIMRKRPSKASTRVAEYRRDLIRRMVEQMINERFGELARKADAKFLNASAGTGSLSRTVEAFVLSARVPDGKLDEGIGALAIEAKRVREFGFSASELERAKRWLAAFYERAYNERDKSESGSFAQELVDYFLDGEPSPGIEYEYRLSQQLLPSITVAAASRLANELLADESRILLGLSPQKADIRIPSEAELKASLASAEQTEVGAWTDTAATRELMSADTKPREAAVASRREISEIGVTIVRFANGVEAWLKPTDFKNDQVLFSLDARGGASLASPDDYLNASLGSSFVTLSGVGGLKALDLQKLLAGKIASATPYVSLSTHGISGNAAPAELETAFQLLYYTFVAPGDDPEAFALLKRQLDAAVANRDRAPGEVFGERIAQVNSSNHYTSEPLTAARVATVNRDAMFAFYRQRFANAADFTLFMVGAFQVADAIPLLARYVGGLPSTGIKTSTFKDIGRRFPDHIERVRVEKGREPRSETVISFFADVPPDPLEQEKIIEATTVLQIALRDALRAELGQTYTVSVGASQSLPQRGDGHLEISFGAAPANVEAMTTRVLQEIKHLQQEGPSEDLTNRAKESAKRDFEISLRQNGYWLRRLEATSMYGTDPLDIARRPQRIDAVTPRILEDTFKRYLPFERYTIITLVPETS